jgi:hypothetical protein
MKPFKDFVPLLEAYNQHINKSNIGGIKSLLNYLKTEYPDVSVEFPLAIDDKTGKIKIKPDFEKAGLTLAAIRKWVIDNGFDIKIEKFGKGSPAGDKTILADFGISNSTSFIEFFQAFGFFVDDINPDGSDFKKIAKVKINGDFPLLGDDFKKLITDLDKHPLKNDAVSLVNGSVLFRKELDITNPYVVWADIKKYYSALLAFEKDIKLGKDNTSDIVVITKGDTLASLETSLKVKGQTIISNKKGKLSTTKKPKVSWYQVSLKESEGGARLGRMTTQLKNKYAGEIGLSNVELALQSKQYDNVENLSLHEFIDLFNEGWFDDIKTFTKTAFDSIKDKLKSLYKWITSFQQTIMSKLKRGDSEPKVKKLMQDISDIVDSERHTGNYVERVAKYKASLNKEEKIGFLKEKKQKEKKKKKLSVQGQIDFIAGNKKALDKFKKLVKGKLDIIVKNNKKGVFKNIKRIPGTVKKAKITKFNLKYTLGNSISFTILNEIMNDIPARNVMDFLASISDDMLMGSTNYPVVKLYGTSASSANYKVLVRTVDAPKASAFKDVYPFIVDIHPSKTGNYYVINFYMLNKPEEDKGKSTFNMVQMNNSGEGFAYKIEGQAQTTYEKLVKNLKIE